MDLSAFKISIQKLTDDELLALLADIRTSRRPVTDLLTVKERAKPKERSSSSGKISVASIKNALSPEMIQKLIDKLTEAS